MKELIAILALLGLAVGISIAADPTLTSHNRVAGNTSQPAPNGGAIPLQ